MKLDVSYCPSDDKGPGSTVGNPDNEFTIYSAGHHHSFTCQCGTEKEMLEWVATFEAKNGRKPTREDIENDSEGNRLFEVFRNAPGKA